MRSVILLYGIACYGIFLLSFVYAVGFIDNLWVPKSMDSLPQTSFTVALLTDLGLLGLFAVQHSVMARPAFKRWWTKIVPQAIERSTYVLLSCIVTFMLVWFWQGVDVVIWDVRHPLGQTVLWGLFAVGWLMVHWSSHR